MWQSIPTLVWLWLLLQGPVLPGGVALPPPEAPALVSNSSDALFEGVKEAVAGGLQEIAANRMTAVG